MINKNQIKEKIKFSFNKAGDKYDQASLIQQQIGQKLIRSLLPSNKHNYSKIIDLGCGTGIATKQLADNLSFNKFHAVDFADNLLAIAAVRLKHHKIKLIEHDYDTLPTNNFDLAFSNMALQWSLDLSSTLKTINNLLDHNGKIAFSIPIQGTLIELKSTSINQFHSPNTIKHLLSTQGFKIKKYFTKKYFNHFSSVLEALNSLKSTGTNCLIKKQQKTLIGKSFLNNIMSSQKNSFTLTYNIGFFIADKSQGSP